MPRRATFDVASVLPPELARDPDAVADALLAHFDVRKPHEIRIELLAYHCGACVLWRHAGGADARVVRAGSRAYLAIAREAAGTPRGRFSNAHELAHHLLHDDYDAIERVHGTTRAPAPSSAEYRVEYQANRFASVVLVPRWLAEPMCNASPPTLDEVRKLARTFDVSLSVAAQRWAELSHAPCAYVESNGGVIRVARRSSAFRGVAVQRRKLEEGTLAIEMARASELAPCVARVRVHESAWGSAELGRGRALVEECVPLDDAGKVLTWLSHA